MAEERSTVTILFGGLTWKHERLIEGLLAGAGYRCQHLPETDRAAHELGKEFCASGLCNPVYFTVGNLVRFLQQKEKAGLSRDEIVRRFVYFTAACGGPCRFGMYESEFRMALRAAGFDGFRVLSFSQDHGIYASTGHSGLQFSADFGWNTLHTFVLGDLLNGVQHRLKPFEIHAEATNKAVARAADAIALPKQSWL
jgi:predicted nucleotide-binding protein (sugar kinase/HSP70/actin superfamily)